MALLIYGSYGYSGNLIVKRAIERGLRPVLAGRDAEKLSKQAETYGLEYRSFLLDKPQTIVDGISGFTVVLNCAGPFSHTAKQMVDACLQTGTHYLDITGEIELFETFAAKDQEAKAAGVMVMPGTGFDVVPTDCLGLYLKNRLPSATKLTLAYRMFGTTASRGTTKTSIEGFYKGGKLRANGAIKIVPAGSKLRDIDFGRGPKTSVLIPWGDVATAYHSTGIPNIEVYSGTHTPLRPIFILSRYLKGFFSMRLVQRILKSFVILMPPGPSESMLAKGRSILWGEVIDGDGNRSAARLYCPEPYLLTAHTAVAITEKALAGNAPPGFQTPAMAYGADLILEIENVRREDLP